MATIYDIAAKAGISPKTAARILSGETQRSKSKKVVLEWAERLGYVRDANAANLRTGSTQIAGLLVPFIDNPYYTSVIQEFHNVLAQKGFRVSVACSFGRADEVVAALKGFRSYNVDGIFFNGSEGELTPEIVGLLEQFQSAGKPVMLSGCNQGRLAVDQADVANAVGIVKVVTYLARQGHERIAFVGGRKANATQNARLEGFQEGLEKCGIPRNDAWISFGETSPIDAGRRCAKILATTEPKRPTAIVCGNDIMAMGVIKTVIKSGLKVPKDVAVTGFDDIEQASLFVPGITTLRQPIDRIAQDCVNQFVRRVAEKDFANPQQYLHELELVVRESA